MSLGAKEQIIYDHITSNSGTREFWADLISEMRRDMKCEDQIALDLEGKLIVIYTQCEDAYSEIEALIDRVSIMTVDFMSIAFKLLGRDFHQEAKDHLFRNQNDEEPLSSRVQRYVRLGPPIPTGLHEIAPPYTFPTKKIESVYFKMFRNATILLLLFFIFSMSLLIGFLLLF